MADLKQKEIIFGLMEVVFAFATVFTLTTIGLVTNSWGKDFACLFGCSGAMVPLMMRFSMIYFSGGTLPKTAEMMVLIWAMALYYAGGLMIIIVRQDKSTLLNNDHYIPAFFALIVAIISTIDLIVGLACK